MAIYLVLFKFLDRPTPTPAPSQPRRGAEPAAPAVAVVPVPAERVPVGLTHPEADPGLVAYAAMVARLGPVRELRFGRLLPDALDRDPVEARAELRGAVHRHLA